MAVSGEAFRKPSDESYESQTADVAAALDVWRKDLIRVSGGSRLINYRATKSSTVIVVAPSANQIFAQLTPNAQLSFAGIPDAQDGEDDEHQGDGRARTFAPPSGVLQTTRPNRELGTVLRNLMRQANTAWLDRGLSVLYLTFGMLSWKDVDESSYKSPLILVPVSLVPLGPRDVPRLEFGEEDQVLNPALALRLTELGVQLPTAGELEDLGISDQLALVKASLGTRDWSVTDEVVISMFSFHKEAMYKDLVENEGQILAHPIVRVLGTSNPLNQVGDLAFEQISPDEVDRIAPPEQVPLVLDADSSQRAAIAAAISARSFVMDGPPGTGKSQTIANMIGALIHAGKTVLFVSEKAAALEVVRNRLEYVGLLSYLLELHSHKASRKEVATELAKTLDTRPRPPVGLSSQQRQSAIEARTSLSKYSEAMNQVRSPLGRSLHEVLGMLAELDALPSAPAPTESRALLTADALHKFELNLADVPLCWRPAEQGRSFLWYGAIDPTSLDVRLYHASSALQHLQEAVAYNSRLARALGLDKPSRAESLERLLELQHQSRPPLTEPTWLTESDWGQLTTARDRLIEHLSELGMLEARVLSLAGKTWRDLPDPGSLPATPESAPAPDRVTMSLSGFSATDCQVGASQLTAAADLLTHASDTMERLTSSWGLGSVASLNDAMIVVDLIALSAAPAKPRSEWFDLESLAVVRQAHRRLQTGFTELRRAEADGRTVFTDAALYAPVDDLLRRFTETHHGLRKLSSAYRDDKRSVAGLLTADSNIRTGIHGLEKAVAWAKASSTYQSLQDHDSQSLGSFGTTPEIDYAGAEQAMRTIERAQQLLGGQSVPSGLRSFLTKAADHAVLATGEALRRDLERWQGLFNQPGPLAGRHSLQLAPLDDIIDSLQAQSQTLLAARDRIHAIDEATGRNQTFSDSEEILSATVRARESAAALELDEEDFQGWFGCAFSGVATDPSAIDEALAWAGAIRELAGGPLTDEQLAALDNSSDGPAIRPLSVHWSQARDAVLSCFDKGREAELRREVDDYEAAKGLLGDLASDSLGQREWFKFRSLQQALSLCGLEAALHFCLDQRLEREVVPGVLRKALLRGWADGILDYESELFPPSAPERDSLVEQFRNVDRELVATAHSAIIRAANSRRPERTGLGEQGVIAREGAKKSRHIPVRDLVSRAKSTVLALKPCFMMSPLAVSQYLPSDIKFDVVIFDEASQVTPGDAINCVYRGRALILAGDEKQLPPTSFFERVTDESDIQIDTDVSDFQSILELAKASGGLRSMGLRWHYRSADEALIAFSNYKFYGGKLVVFPSPGSDVGETAVSFTHVDGVYRRGSAADNPIEAARVAHAVIQHFIHTPDQTLGVVTFSVAQTNAVQDAIDKAREDHRELDKYFDKTERLHAFFVKSLESVQGDERDRIIFSVGYGPDEQGRVYTNFGVLNRDKGWRRLNVAITRARRSVQVISSMRAGDIPPTSNENVEYLRSYLDYAERGLPALALKSGTSDLGPESPFEESVLAAITSWGYDVESQVGTAGYRIDIGVRHPNKPGLFVLGVECDGYQYHSAPIARDRDRLRDQILTRLGWTMHRIWGTAWYRNREQEETRLRIAIESALTGGAVRSRGLTGSAAVQVEMDGIETDLLPMWSTPYQFARLPRPSRFYDPSDPDTRFYMSPGIDELAKVEGPVHLDVVFQRFRDAWNIGRVGNKIRDNIQAAIRLSSAALIGDFLDVPGRPVGHVRTPSSDYARKVEHVHLDELGLALGLLLRDSGTTSQDELFVATARVFSWNRTGQGIQSRLTEALAKMETDGLIARSDDLLIWIASDGSVPPPNPSARAES